MIVGIGFLPHGGDCAEMVRAAERPAFAPVPNQHRNPRTSFDMIESLELNTWRFQAMAMLMVVPPNRTA
jgi:hypothetical protein